MIKSLTLTCFGKHEQAVFNFSEGTTVWRGANESGKSTALSGLAYALFGSRALPSTLEDMVTWGRNARELKAVVEYGDFTIARSKGGAEVTSMGQVLVTGQVEVTKFCENLLGCDASTATNLMFAGQTGLRGVLESGPKATATLLEQVSGFDLFDRVLDAAQSRLSLGSAAIQEDRLRNLLSQLEAIPRVDAPDEVSYRAERSGLTVRSAEIADELKVLQPNLGEVDAAIAAEVHVRTQRDQAVVEINRVQKQIEDNDTETARIPRDGKVVDTSALEKRIACAAEHATTLAAYQKFQSVPEVDRWTRAEFDTHLADIDAALKAEQVRTTDLAQAIKVAEAKLISSSTCGFCGQDVSAFPEVARKNAELQAEIQASQKGLEEANQTIGHLEAGRQSLLSIQVRAPRVIATVKGIEAYLDRDDNLVPPKFSWRGEVPSAERVDVAALQKELASLKEANRATIANTAKLELLVEQRAKLQARLRELTERRDKIRVMSDDDFQYLTNKSTVLRATIESLGKEREKVAAEVQALEQAYTKALDQWLQSETARVDIQARIEETKAEIETLQVNNLLVRKIRAARPVVGNKLWSMVLASVSAIFSQMRGEDSIVQKGEAGFLINGKAATSYSGSTLDLLGLALRCALIKTFVPNCSFLVLDEPSSACDQARTNAMLGYIAASGFKQVLLVTHNEASESFADNLIEL
jgi:DNA repair exonuclease SbcCD ATPase subunit